MRIVICFALIFLVPTIQAQEADANLGSILNTFADGIKPEAFKGKFTDDLDGWKEQSKGIDGLDVKSFKDQMKGLIGGLKGKAFEEVSRGNLLKQLIGVNGLPGMKEMLSSLISSLNPEMLTDDFNNQKSMILETLNKL